MQVVRLNIVTQVPRLKSLLEVYINPLVPLLDSIPLFLITIE